MGVYFIVDSQSNCLIFFDVMYNFTEAKVPENWIKEPPGKPGGINLCEKLNP